MAVSSEKAPAPAESAVLRNGDKPAAVVLVPAIAPDGGWGWFVVFASFIIHVFADGLVYSFGLFYVEFLEDFGSTKGETSVVASLMVGISLLAGPLASALVNRYGCRVTAIVGAAISALGFLISAWARPLASALVNRYGCRVTAIVGAAISALGFLISAWAPNVYFLYFSYGIMSGLGFGLLIHPAIVIVGQYFDKRRSLTTGFAVCGSGVGMFLFPPIISALVDAYAWQGASIVLAGVLLNLCICGAVYRPLPPRALVLPEDRDAGVDTKLLDTIETDNNIRSQPNNLDSLEVPTRRTRAHTEPAVVGSMQDLYALSRSEIRSQTSGSGDNGSGVMALLREFKAELKATTNFGLLKDVPFLLFAFSGTLTSIGFNAPYIFIPHHAELHGIDEQSASFLISIIGITNIFGRVMFGFLGDRVRSMRLYLFCMATVFTGLCTALSPLCTTYPLMATYAGTFGFTVGGVVALNWVLLPDLVGVEHLASSLGLCMMFDGLSTPFGPPFLGWVFDLTGNYNYSFIIGGVMIVISGLILFPIPCIRHKSLTCVLNAKITEMEL